MKILKYNESKAEQFRHVNAQLLADKLGEKFFQLDEFEKIVVDEEEGQFEKSFMFYICFTEIHKETIDAMEKFNQFIGRVAPDQLVFKGEQLKFDREFHIYDFIDLFDKDIKKYLKQLLIEEEAKKYNL